MNADLREVELEPSTFASRFASPPVDSRMRVLQLGPALAVRGGISSVERLICEYMKPYAAIRHVPTMEDGSAVARGLAYARAVQVLWRALADIDPVIVHIHFASRGSTLRKVVLADMVARAGRPLVLHAHGARFDQFHRRLPAPLRRKVNRTLQRANLVIALSSQWREFFVEECELAPAKVTVLPNPVRWNAAPPDRSGRPHVQFLSLGRLSERKGSYDLVNAFAALPRELRARARLVLAGDGDVEGVRQLAAPLGDAVRAIERATERIELPASIRDSFQGTAQAFQASLENTPLLILAALVTVYIVLGILYESYVHPLTILSTLPSAGVGALLALMLVGTEFSIMALIGLILLIGIVKKNAIMMIDFALEAERKDGKRPVDAIYEACLLRFRPIMMTTMAALLAALPLAVSSGVGAELRRPLGIAIVGGLIVSQALTLYTTPVVYLAFDRLARRLAARREQAAAGDAFTGEPI